MSTSPASGPPAFVRLAAHPLRWQLLTALAGSDYRVRELVTLLDQPQNLLSYHLRLLREGGLVSSTRSSHDGRDSYYHLDLDHCAQAMAEAGATLHPALRRDPGPVSSSTARGLPRRRQHRPAAVLFVCTGNSVRSPIAEALLRHHGAGSVTATSAGTRPQPHLHPHAVRLLGEQFGIDVTAQQPRDLAALTGVRFDQVVTLCDRAREALPAFTHTPRRTHWSIRDPAATTGSARSSHAAFQEIAGDIDTRVRHLLASVTVART